MNKKYLSVISAVSILIFSSQIVYAVERPNVDKWAEQALKLREKLKGGENLPVDLGERANTIKERRDKICKNAQERVNERWSKYYARRMDRVENMDKGVKILEKRAEFYNSLQGISANLQRKLVVADKSKGLNVTNLESDLVALKALVGEYKTEYMKFLEALEVVKTLPCANYEGEFLPKLKAVKDQWLVVKQKADSIRDYYRGTVKKHLEELRAQLPEEE